MKKKIRITLGSLLALFGIVFFILPGSILVLLLGLVMLSYDVPRARDWLRTCQNVMSKSARKLDKIILDRKLKI
ncbi:tellurium resistance protein TerC [Paraglaciecola arctica]|uniref:Integral membrane protein TerC n=1 Tax=Paraglaciecola arctica BSs20135 TaxID=493475 RepID=K6YN85_9ALTE|nr:tellurium resistance protein TerC [Paraglaciecola arctica]GAC19647.1 integral membrane protein TerC [Paraglaciecola arctica BSs20135]